MATDAVEKSFCTTREAAVLLGVSVGTVQIWVESGLLQAWKTVGGHRRVLRDSVDRLIRKVPDDLVAQTPVAPSVNAQRKLSVLVVDDDADLLRLYQTQLSRWPMPTNVICIDNAVSALMMMGRGGPDLLIADLHMPRMDGFSMLRVLSKAPEMTNTTMVVVTGLDAASIAQKGGLPTGIEVLSKPIPFERLLTIAQAIVSTSSFQLAAA
jgi:excisionase family DNA binding protein